MGSYVNHFFFITMVTPIPTLDTQGWVYEASPKIDYALSYFIMTDAKQSNIYEDNISSLQKIVQEYSGDPLQTGEQISRTIQAYLGRYYENVTAEARWELTNPDSSQTTVKITLLLNFTEDGVVYTVNRLLTYFNGKFQSITQANNG